MMMMMKQENLITHSTITSVTWLHSSACICTKACKYVAIYDANLFDHWAAINRTGNVYIWKKPRCNSFSWDLRPASSADVRLADWGRLGSGSFTRGLRPYKRRTGSGLAHSTMGMHRWAPRGGCFLYNSR